MSKRIDYRKTYVPGHGPMPRKKHKYPEIWRSPALDVFIIYYPQGYLEYFGLDGVWKRCDFTFKRNGNPGEFIGEIG